MPRNLQAVLKSQKHARTHALKNHEAELARLLDLSIKDIENQIKKPDLRSLANSRQPVVSHRNSNPKTTHKPKQQRIKEPKIEEEKDIYHFYTYTPAQIKEIYTKIRKYTDKF